MNTNPGRHKFGGATQRAGETSWTPSFYPWSFGRIPTNCPTSGIIITEIMEYQVQGSSHAWVIPILKGPEGLSGHHINKKPHDIISLEIRKGKGFGVDTELPVGSSRKSSRSCSSLLGRNLS